MDSKILLTIVAIITFAALYALIATGPIEQNTGINSPGNYTCNVNNQSGTYDHTSTTGLTAYPYSTNTTGSKQCTNGSIKGVWSRVTLPGPTQYTFNTDHCLAKNGQLFCFASTNNTEDYILTQCIANNTSVKGYC